MYPAVFNKDGKYYRPHSSLHAVCRLVLSCKAWQNNDMRVSRWLVHDSRLGKLEEELPCNSHTCKPQTIIPHL